MTASELFNALGENLPPQLGSAAHTAGSDAAGPRAFARPLQEAVEQLLHRHRAPAIEGSSSHAPAIRQRDPLPLLLPGNGNDSPEAESPLGPSEQGYRAARRPVAPAARPAQPDTPTPSTDSSGIVAPMVNPIVDTGVVPTVLRASRGLSAPAHPVEASKSGAAESSLRGPGPAAAAGLWPDGVVPSPQGESSDSRFDRAPSAPAALHARSGLLAAPLSLVHASSASPASSNRGRGSAAAAEISHNVADPLPRGESSDPRFDRAPSAPAVLHAPSGLLAAPLSLVHASSDAPASSNRGRGSAAAAEISHNGADPLPRGESSDLRFDRATSAPAHGDVGVSNAAIPQKSQASAFEALATPGEWGSRTPLTGPRPLEFGVRPTQFEAAIKPSIDSIDPSHDSGPESTLRRGEPTRSAPVDSAPMGLSALAAAPMRGPIQPAAADLPRAGAAPSALNVASSAVQHSAASAPEQPLQLQEHPVRAGSQPVAVDIESVQTPTDLYRAVESGSIRSSAHARSQSSRVNGAMLTRVQPDSPNAVGSAPIPERAWDGMDGQSISEPTTGASRESSRALQMDGEFETEVARHVARMVRIGSNRAEIHMDPRDLGPIEIQVTVREQQVSVTFVAADATVRQALHGNADHLREMLAEQGISLADAQVGGDGASSGHSPDRDANKEPSPGNGQGDTGPTPRPPRHEGALDAFA